MAGTSLGLGPTSPPVHAAAAPVDATAAQDWSGDGRADVVAPTRDGRLWLYRGNGAGGFVGTKTVSAGRGLQLSSGVSSMRL